MRGLVVRCAFCVTAGLVAGACGGGDDSGGVATAEGAGVRVAGPRLDEAVASPPTALEGERAQVIVSSDGAVVAGGSTTEGGITTASTAVGSFDAGARAWRALPSLPQGSYVEGGAEVDGALHLVARRCDGRVDDLAEDCPAVVVYRLDGDAWEAFPAPGDVFGEGTAIGSVAPFGDGALAVSVDGDRATAFAVFDPADGSWEAVAPPEASNELGVCLTLGEAYLFRLDAGATSGAGAPDAGVGAPGEAVPTEGHRWTVWAYGPGGWAGPEAAELGPRPVRPGGYAHLCSGGSFLASGVDRAVVFSRRGSGLSADDVAVPPQPAETAVGHTAPAMVVTVEGTPLVLVGGDVAELPPLTAGAAPPTDAAAITAVAESTGVVAALTQRADGTAAVTLLPRPAG